MKELQIIVKRPDDGNPLNQEKGVEPNGNMISVGFKFRDETGKWYGDYILLGPGFDRGAVTEAVELLLGQAYRTEAELIRKEDGYYE